MVRGGAAVARIAVDHAEADGAVLRPARRRRRSRSGASSRRPSNRRKLPARQARDQRDDRAALGVLRAAAADRGAAGADPVAHAGRLGQARADQVERVGERVAGVDEAEIGRRRQVREALDAGLAGAMPVRAAPGGRPEHAPCRCPPAGLSPSAAVPENQCAERINFEAIFLLTNISRTLMAGGNVGWCIG